MGDKHQERRPEDIAPRLWLKRTDQATTAALVCVALAFMAIYWWRQGGLQGRLIEVKRLPQRTAKFQVDINTAAWTELSQIPEIGETLARRIIDYREQHGPFRRPEELLAVPGIGSRTLERMLPAIKPLSTDDAPPN